MTPKQAKELCILAHKGQFRKGCREITETEEQELITLTEADEDADVFFINTGVKLIWSDETNDWMAVEPYSSHPIAVAEMFTTDDEKIVAYLHDAIEDTFAELCEGMVTSDHILFNSKRYNLSNTVYEALKMLTKTDGITYEDYIKNLVINKSTYTRNTATIIAIKVKIADMMHDMSTASEKQKKKYLKHLPVLLEAL